MHPGPRLRTAARESLVIRTALGGSAPTRCWPRPCQSCSLRRRVPLLHPRQPERRRHGRNEHPGDLTALQGQSAEPSTRDDHAHREQRQSRVLEPDEPGSALEEAGHAEEGPHQHRRVGCGYGGRRVHLDHEEVHREQERQGELDQRIEAEAAGNERVELLDPRGVERSLRRFSRGSFRPPRRAGEPDPQAISPGVGEPGVSPQVGVHVEVGPQRVPAPQRGADAVEDLLVLSLVDEGLEQAIPHHEHAAEVPVEAVVVLAVVDAVIRRRREPAVEPTEPSDQPGVDPVLIQKVDHPGDSHHQRRDADHRQRPVEEPAQHEPGRGLPQRGGEVVLLARMMDDVRRPEHVHLVGETVEPVVAEVVSDQRERPGPPRVGRKPEQCEVLPRDRVDAEPHRCGEYAGDLAHHPQADAGDRVVAPVRVPAARPASEELHQDEQDEDGRCGRDDQFVHLRSSRDLPVPSRA